MDLRLPSPLQRLDDERLGPARLLLKRDDLIHGDFPGNKWRKLKYNIEAARALGHGTLLTFGGAYSNHLRATAAAGHHFGFATIGVVRGEEHTPLNPVLARAEALGMTLTYADRTRYRNKSGMSEELRERYGDFFLIPEGGANRYALKGCAELVSEIEPDFDVICFSSGTGATLAGAATALRPHQRAVGFAAVKGDFLGGEVRRLQAEYGHPTANWEVDNRFHFGGFAKRTRALTDFVDDFRERHGITLDPVYEGKMMYALLTRPVRAGTTLIAVL